MMIPCDFCLEKPQSAEKRCLTCEASLCQAHLSKHNSKTTQKDHTLVPLNTGGSLEEQKCSEHAQLLEYFCQDDLVCLCSLCFATDAHKDHNTVALKAEYDKQMTILSLIVKSMQENKTAIDKALEHLQKSEIQIKSNTKTLTDQLSKLFQQIKSQIDQKEKQILGDIQSNEKKQLVDIMVLRKQMEEKQEAAVQSLWELQGLAKQRDACLFLKDFHQAQERIKKENFSSDNVEVLTVHLDQPVIQDFSSHTAVYFSNLDSLMQVVHDGGRIEFCEGIPVCCHNSVWNLSTHMLARSWDFYERIGKIINQTQWSRAIPAAEFSLDDVICEVFPSPQSSPLTRKIIGINPAAHLIFGSEKQNATQTPSI